LLAAAFCLWVGLAAPHRGEAADSPTIAVVNNQRLSQGDLDFLFLSRRVAKDQQAAVRERFIDDLIDRALLKQFLDKRKVDFSREMLDQQVARIETVIKDDGKNVNEVLRSLGYNRETLRTELALPLRWRSYANSIITDATLKAYWETHRHEFDGTEIKAAQIVKKLPTTPSASDIEAAKKTLADLRAKLIAKELKFAEAARQFSDSPFRGSRQGRIDKLRSGRLIGRDIDRHRQNTAAAGGEVPDAPGHGPVDGIMDATRRGALEHEVGWKGIHHLDPCGRCIARVFVPKGIVECRSGQDRIGISRFFQTQERLGGEDNCRGPAGCRQGIPMGVVVLHGDPVDDGRPRGRGQRPPRRRPAQKDGGEDQRPPPMRENRRQSLA